MSTLFNWKVTKKYWERKQWFTGSIRLQEGCTKKTHNGKPATQRGWVCLCPGHECEESTVALGDGNTANALMLRTAWALGGVLALRETNPLCEDKQMILL